MLLVVSRAGGLQILHVRKRGAASLHLADDGCAASLDVDQ